MTSLFQSLMKARLPLLAFSPSSSFLGPIAQVQIEPACHRSNWRYEVGNCKESVYPNYKKHTTHRRHFHLPHTFGVQSTSRLRCVDNSKIGMEAMADGRPPYIFHVYSRKHRRKPHGTYGKLGDKVYCAVKGQKVHGILVGLKINQLPGIPRFDSNNVVLIDPQGNPLGTRIHVPIPHCIRPILKHKSDPKKADYTKLLALATRFV